MGRKTITTRPFKYRGFQRLRRLGSFVAVIAFFAGAAWLAVQLDPAGPALSCAARASDGDTLVLARERIRLLGIDAPELAQVCWHRDGAQWPCGKTAHDRLAALIRGKTLACAGDERDKYHRLLATCTVEKRDLGAILVREGLAIADWDYKAEEIEARAKGVGIWNGRFDVPRDWRDAHNAPPSEPTIFDWIGSWF